MTPMDNSPQSIGGIFDTLRRLLTLNFEYARLSAAEKTTVLLSTIAFYAVMIVVGALALLFISFGVGHLLAVTVAHVAAFLYVAAFYVALLILVIVFRRKLFIDPIAKFVSRLFVAPPTNDDKQ